MSSPADQPVNWSPHRTAAKTCLLLTYLGLCFGPYLVMARFPSLFDDDFTRVGGLRRLGWLASFWRPFNEHLAPLFDLVSRFAWWGSGERVEVVAAAFLATSYLAALATAVALAAVVYLEVGSSFGALVAVALFCLESVALETVAWFSASSFQWSAASSLAAWFAATRALRATTPPRRRDWLIAAGLLALISPLFSAIGVLAGPLAAWRLLLDHESRRWSRLVVVVAPLGGTLVYLLLVAGTPGPGSAVSASLRQHVDPVAAGWAMLRAPGLILVPALVGFPARAFRLSDPLAVLGTTALVLGMLGWAVHDRARRGLILSGLGWVLGGYTLAFLARAEPGDRWIMEVGRYHLFPLLGAITWLAAGVGPLLDRLEVRRPLLGWSLLVLLAAVGLVIHGPTMLDRDRRTWRFPGQDRPLAAALRLEAICQAAGIPLDQAIRIIDPIAPRWFPHALPFNPLLYLFGPGPSVARGSDLEARRRVVDQLSPTDRGLIFGGLDASPYLVDRAGPDDGRAEWVVPWSSQGERTTQDGDQAFYVEFEIPAEVGEPTELIPQGISPATRIEIWWAGPDGRWSREQGVRLVTTADPRPIALTRLPHWRSLFARRFRIIRRAGPFRSTHPPRLILKG